MNTLVRLTPILAVLFSSGSAVLGFGEDGPVEVNPSSSIQVKLHPDWFVTHYDEVRDLTTIQTKDEFGPGDRARCDFGDAVKVDLMGILEGKTFGPDSKFTAKFYFHRMAGTNGNGSVFEYKGHEKEFVPFDQDTKKLLHFAVDAPVYFLTSSGERFKAEGDDLAYELKVSKGLLGEIYLWETISVCLDWKQLNQLSDGGKVAISDRTVTFSGDNISLVRTLISIMNSMNP